MMSLLNFDFATELNHIITIFEYSSLNAINSPNLRDPKPSSMPGSLREKSNSTESKLLVLPSLDAQI